MIDQIFSKKFLGLAPKLSVVSVFFMANSWAQGSQEHLWSFDPQGVRYVETSSGVVIPESACSKVFGTSIYTFAPKEVEVYSTAEVQDRLEAEQARGNQSDRALIRFYENMLKRGGNRYVISPPAVEAFKQLIESTPNHKKVAQDIMLASNLARSSGEPLHFDPILLLGNAGVGKTHFANEMARILGTDFQLISMGSMTAGWLISGSSSQWNGAKPGKVLSGLVNGQNANQIYVVDEVDKAGGGQYDPLGALYGLLESETAQKFVDEFAEVRIDASRVLWILTANNESQIPEPILNRMNVYVIEMPTDEEVRQIAKSVYKKILTDHPKWDVEPDLRENVLAALSDLPPRDMHRILKKGVAVAFDSGRRHLVPEDLDLSKATSRKGKIGFNP